MLSNFTANSITAKTHALYGQKLNDKNYSDLLSCKTVGEVAAYLKTRTAYGDVLGNVTAAALHRTQLETILKRRLFDRYVSLCRYEMSIGQDFYRYFIIKGDIEQIITCLRLLSTENPHDYLLVMSDFFNSHTDIDLYALAAAKNMKDVLSALEGSPYKKIIEPFYTEDLDHISITQIESALENYMRDTVKRFTVKAFSAKDSKEILDFFRAKIDLQNICRLYRVKSFYKSTNQKFLPITAEYDFSLLKKGTIDEMINAESREELLEILKTTVYGKDFAKFNFTYIEDYIQRVFYYRCLRNFRFSTNPYVTMLCYTYLAETEVNNIIHIIEGIRYNVPPEEISALLIGAEIKS